jgi:TolA-binding protein
MAYLHVPVFYRDEHTIMPAALLGSAQAYLRLDQNELARKSLQELIKTFPQSAEAAAAQIELQKTGK